MEIEPQPSCLTYPAMARMHPEDRVHQARVAASVLFLVDGMTFGTWAALIPSFKRAFTLSEGQLGWVLFGLIGGAMVSMPITGRVVARWGSDRLAIPAALAFSATLILLAWTPSYGALIAAAVLFGLGKGVIDVSINSQAITVENAAARPIMSRFQAFWSLGGLAAACVLSVLLHFGFTHIELMLGMTPLLLAMSAACRGRLLPDAAPLRAAAEAEGQPAKRNGQLALLGGIAFLALFSEGVMLDWSAVYAHSVAQIPIAMAPLGFAIFALCMAAGRFLGDLIAARTGPAGVLRLSGFVLAGGIALAVAWPAGPTVLAGFALVGLGVANMVPVIFSAAGRLQGHGKGSTLATVTTTGYIGFLAGPPVVGFIASGVGLPLAFSIVILAGLLISTVGLRAVTPGTHRA